MLAYGGANFVPKLFLPIWSQTFDDIFFLPFLKYFSFHTSFADSHKLEIDTDLSCLIC